MTLTNKLLLSASLLALFSCSSPNHENTSSQQKQNPLLGSWEVASIHWITKDTTISINEAQPGLFIIEKDRYSNMWTPTREARVPFAKLSSPTDDEMKAGFRSVVFNAGSYTMTDSTLTTTAFIAKVPGFEGGIQYYDYTIKDNMLTLTMFDETYSDGTKPEWFGTYKTRFILKKVN